MSDARAAFLAQARTGLDRPAHDPRAAPAGIVHLGLGAFHRAHQAPVIDACLAAGDDRWAITGVCMRHDAVCTALASQGHAYVLEERGAEGADYSIVSAHRDTLVAATDPQAVVSAMSAPEVRLVTLTVTEAGYLRAPDGGLDIGHPALSGGRTSIYDLILGALARRRDAGAPPPTLLSCDNLAENGTVLGRCLRSAAEIHGHPASLLDGVSTPSTMVDRITPATTDADRERVAAATGLPDRWPVVTEPFSQWVIEDAFANGRPDWEPFGVEMVTDVQPWEQTKLRLLNGAHSLIAYAGLLAGHATVADAHGDATIRAAVARLWASAIPTLRSRMQDAAPAYTRALAKRFDNPSLRHACAQIATDGSEKLPQRIVAPAAEIASRGGDPAPVACVIALWAEALRCHPGAFDDPASGRLSGRLDGPADDTAASLLAALGAAPNGPLAGAVARMLTQLRARGIAALISEEA